MEPRPTTTFEINLTDDQIAFFLNNGFLSIDSITTDEEVEWLKSVYDDLFNNRIGEKDGAYFDLGGRRAHDGKEVLPQVLGPERTYPELRETTYFMNSRKLSAQLLQLPLDQVNGGGHMILKPAGYGRETPWHQDEAYWNPSVRHHGLSVWMPLDPATVESGCMQFIPRSHLTDEIVMHKHIDDDPLVHGLVTEQVDPSKAVACPIDAGGATFHYCRTLHYAGPNQTDRVRRAYINVMSGPSKKLDKPDVRPWQEEAQQALAKLKTLAREQA
ncbi:MAG: phytanoyl-CoA dioxygenase family protein [Candidatus Poribacteria bacterium]|nr:phytanoyl-CoA dioxygenase family protein [Candidatus Poribacteria bacterium]